MIQPIRTLRDHPNVFELPNRDQINQRRGIKADPPTDDDDPVLNSAFENVMEAMSGRKVNIDDFLLSDPKRPEIDKKMVKKNRAMTKKMALLQAIDSIASVAGRHAAGEEAINTSARFDRTGLQALNNLANIDQEHKLDLRQFNQKKDRVEEYNNRLGMNNEIRNNEIDYEVARTEYDSLLSQKTAEALGKDKEKERMYEAGLRSISQGDKVAADFYLSRAGLGSEEIKALRQKGKESEAEDGSLVAGVKIEPKQQALYSEYQHYLDQVDDSQYMLDERRQPDYSKPKPGTAAWHVDKLLNQMGDDFYVIDHAMRPEREQIQQQTRQNQQERASAELQQSPQIQRAVRQSRVTQQQILEDEFFKTRSFESQQDIAALWLKNNRDLLIEEGVPENQIDELNEQMFLKVLESKRSTGGGSAQQDQSSQQSDSSATNQKPNRRESIPAHLRQTYDVGNKYLEQKHRLDEMKRNNPDADLSVGQRELERRLQELKRRFSTLAKDEDRKALESALGINPNDL